MNSSPSDAFCKYCPIKKGTYYCKHDCNFWSHGTIKYIKYLLERGDISELEYEALTVDVVVDML